MTIWGGIDKRHTGVRARIAVATMSAAADVVHTVATQTGLCAAHLIKSVD